MGYSKFAFKKISASPTTTQYEANKIVDLRSRLKKTVSP
jgi:hypothetical protein